MSDYRRTYVDKNDPFSLKNSKFCPKCGAELKIKIAKSGKYAGQKFYGCSRFPDCRYTYHINENEKEKTTEIKEYSDSSEYNVPVKLTTSPRIKGFTTSFFDSIAVPSETLNAIYSEKFPKRLFTDFSKWRIDYFLPKNAKKPTPVQNSQISIIEKIINRGRITKLSPKLETEIIRLFSHRPNFETISTTQIFSTYTQYDPNASETKWFDSENEEKFYREVLLSAVGSENAKDILSQVEFSSLVKDKKSISKENLSQRVDFLITHGKESLIVELDDSTHIGHSDKDKLRDEILKNSGFKTYRITTKDFLGSSEKVESLKNKIRSMYSSDPPIHPQNINKTLIAIKLAHEFQVSLVELIKVGKINSSEKTSIFFDSDSIPTIPKNIQEKILKLALKDLKELDSKLAHFYNLRPLFEDIEINFSDSNQTIIFSSKNKNFAPEKIILLEEINFPFELEQNIVSDFSPLKPIQKNYEFDLKFFLKYIFGFDGFRNNQLEGIVRTINRKDSIILLPTSSGKSLIYQLSAFLIPGTSIIIEPIISLINDQIDGLTRHGIDRAVGVSSSTKNKEEIQTAISRGAYNIIYISPERLQVESFRIAIEGYSRENQIALCAIDEAHCVSEWGHDFRTSYLNLASTCRNLLKTDEKVPPIIALTGTASPSVLKDMQRDLHMNDGCLIRPESFDRKEIIFDVISTNSSEKSKVLDELLLDKIPLKFDQKSYLEFFLPNNEKTNSGIVFCPHRDGKFGVETIMRHIRNLKISTTKYYGEKSEHTKLSKEEWDLEKTKNANNFKNNKIPLLVATKSFGMGIDKPNVRFSIHYGLPGSIESLYQEAGRIGRDHKPAYSFTIFSNDFPDRNKELLDSSGDFNKIKAFLDKKKRGDEDDISRALYFHAKSFKGINDELEITKQILKKINGISKPKTVSIVSEGDTEKRNLFEKNLYRLSVLGIIKNYTVSYSNNEYTLEIYPFNKERIYKSFLEYVSSYQSGNYAINEAEKLRQISEENPNKYVFFAMKILLEFIYEIIEKGKRRALSSLVKILNEARHLETEELRNEKIRKQILDYLGSVYTERLGQVINEIDSIKTARKIIDLNKKKDKSQIFAEASRMLESYPDHPGLLFITGIANLSKGEFNFAISDLIKSYDFATKKYKMNSEIFLNDFAPTICGEIELLPKETATMIIEKILEGIESEFLPKYMLENLPPRLRTVPMLKSLNNLISKIDKSYERKKLWKAS